jgi:formate dehydrogenase major subunit
MNLKLTTERLNRRAIVYVRQSSPGQVLHNKRASAVNTAWSIVLENSAFARSSWAYRGENDPTLEHPMCVLQITRRHFARYTPEMVADVCGVPRQVFLKVAEALCRNSGRQRTSAFCYAVGWTQHTTGAQFIRTASIIQTLLGNMGRPGGGIMALRGHACIQGSTDIPTLYNVLPGYLPMPHANGNATFEQYAQENTKDSGWWSEFPKKPFPC